MTELTQAMIINAAVLVAVLEADLGPHRKIGKFRILRPLLLAAAIIPLFLASPATHGAGLALELAATVAGVLLGLAALALIRVYRSPRTGKPASHATFGYAALWIVVIGARATFSYGSYYWFPAQLGHWALAHQVTGAAITDALVGMAIAMTLTRTIGLAVRARKLPAAAAAAAPAHAQA
jgi:hypothetical protein